MNIHIQVFIGTPVSILLDLHMGVKLLSHMVILCLTFWETAKLFSTVPGPFYFTTSNVPGSDFSTSLPTPVIFLFNKMIPILVGVKWYFIVVSTCISLVTNYAENLFMCLLVICISSLEKCLLFKNSAHFTVGLSVLLWLSSKCSFYILNTRPFYKALLRVL